MKSLASAGCSHEFDDLRLHPVVCAANIGPALEQAELTYVVTSPALKEVTAYVTIF